MFMDTMDAFALSAREKRLTLKDSIWYCSYVFKVYDYCMYRRTGKI